MRQLVVCNFMSLDGYFEGPGHDVMALPFDPHFDEYNLERIRAASTLLTGRSTFQQLMSFWIPLSDGTTASPLQREIGRFNRDVHKVVVSDSLRDDDVGPKPTTVIRRAEATGYLQEIKAQEGGDILVFGSRTTWNPLLSAGLVDQLHLMVGCAAIGGGTPLFAGSTPRMHLIDVRRFPDSSNVVLVYKPTAAGTP